MSTPNSFKLVVAGLLMLAACDRPSGQAAPAQSPSLWEAAALDDSGRPTDVVQICADDRIRAAFSRPIPVSGGQTCDNLRVRRDTAEGFSAVCRMGGQPIAVTAHPEGDRKRNFKLEITIQRLPDGQVRKQLRLYREAAPTCPPGWTVGSASRVDRPGVFASKPGEVSNPAIDR